MKRSIIRFAIVGTITTVIDFIIYWFISKTCDISVAKCISMLLASIVSYFLNKLWTFENNDKKNSKYLWKFYVTFGVNMGINISVNRLVYSLSNNKIWAFILATGCATVVNYILQRVWVFKDEKNKGEEL